MIEANVQTVIRHLKRQLNTPEVARFNMQYWGSSIKNAFFKVEELLEIPVCNTQACLAGETVLALGAATLDRENGGLDLVEEFKFRDIENAAADLLGLTGEEKKRLFWLKGWSRYTMYGWPDQFEQEYKEAKTPRARLEVAIRRLEFFLKTNGTDIE